MSQTTKPAAKDSSRHQTVDSKTPSPDANITKKSSRYLEISQGTSIIHPNTGLRKSWSVGCTQSLEHSSGMWYDGREHPSGALDNLDFDGEYYDDDYYDACCGRENDHEDSMYMSYYGGQVCYADSEAVYSDEEGGSFDGEDDDEDDDDLIYMRRTRRGANSDTTEGSSVSLEDPKSNSDTTKESHFDPASYPIDAHELHGKLARLQIKSCT